MVMLKTYGALLVFVVANVVAFGGVLWNRSGEPTGEIVFDSCELNARTIVGYVDPRYVRLSTVSLPNDEIIGEEFGDTGASDSDRKVWQERRLFVLIEHDGPAWKAFEQSKKGAASFSNARYKLIVVEGSRSAESLLNLVGHEGRRAIMRGYVRDNLLLEIADRKFAIESRYRETFKKFWLDHDARLAAAREAAPDRRNVVYPPCEPTHNVTVKWGRSFEPWIASVEPIVAD